MIWLSDGNIYSQYKCGGYVWVMAEFIFYKKEFAEYVTLIPRPHHE